MDLDPRPRAFADAPRRACTRPRGALWRRSPLLARGRVVPCSRCGSARRDRGLRLAQPRASRGDPFSLPSLRRASRMRPSAIFESLPIIPTTTALVARRLAAWRTATPTKSPTCTKPALHATHCPALHTRAPASPLLAPHGIPFLTAVISWQTRPASVQVHVPFWQSFGAHAAPPMHEGGLIDCITSGTVAASEVTFPGSAPPVLLAPVSTVGASPPASSGLPTGASFVVASFGPPQCPHCRAKCARPGRTRRPRTRRVR
jgi:hypothetical protein